MYFSVSKSFEGKILQALKAQPAFFIIKVPGLDLKQDAECQLFILYGLIIGTYLKTTFPFLIINLRAF